DQVVWTTYPNYGTLDPAFASQCAVDNDKFNTCPAGNYFGGGYGISQNISANRWIGQLKSMHFLSGLGLHQLKYGSDFELNTYRNKREISGPDGSRAFVYNAGDSADLYRFYRGSSDMPIYPDHLDNTGTTKNFGFFLQDAYSPLPNLTVSAGARWEFQRLDD